MPNPLHSFLQILEILSKGFDIEVFKNLRLSTNFSLYIADLLLSISF